jgi:hypothetical protein
MSSFQALLVISIMHRHQTSGFEAHFSSAHFFRPFAMPRSAIIPAGSWPRRMPAAIAAGYCGAPTVEAFKARRHRISSTADQRREPSAVVARRSGPGHRTGQCRATSPRIFNTGTPAPTLRRGAQARRQLATSGAHVAQDQFTCR